MPADGTHLGHPGSFPGVLLDSPPAVHQFDLICNHAVMDLPKMRTFLGAAPFVVTILREPAGQMLSAFNWYVMGGRNGGVNATGAACSAAWDAHLKRLESLDCVRETGVATCTPDTSTRKLSTWTGTNATAARRTIETTLRYRGLWRDSIDASLGLVMLLDRLDEGLLLLRRKMQWPLSALAGLPMKRHTTGCQLLKLSRARSVSAVDTALYNHFGRRGSTRG
ncbi:hypothetical protein EMIHUDRAFT_227714 [Emiliania huxleyi CCMP1516]|uniref:Sulfotransferase domain-containing protein n=2 Tax=Emiliania huxleyi TaxID=2903 RepID=A0A0D3KHE3_EMIH1|nr:hypothetical protein EMIHUDRAFT_227714 [Emiliania huxleyi CCMP1516]EOD35178.1 hypothetical protein EMIHUDRAFT_227714 [Emiliania huxleyi CCMP1516]|eukprot:XP_005787607.1 hypothetical protein EMIHUDRAFT_227714 [Emiliania huxleyi CCMP1516]